MKKFLYLFLVAVLAFSMVACGENTPPVEPETGTGEEQGEPIVNEPEIKNPDEIENAKFYFPTEDLEKYEVVQVIQLDENPSTGYGWQYTIEDETIAVVEGDEYGQNEAEDGMVGVGGIHAYRLSGLKEGETKITFKYLRSWEGEESVTETVSFVLKVNSENKLAIISEIH